MVEHIYSTQTNELLYFYVSSTSHDHIHKSILKAFHEEDLLIAPLYIY